MYTFYIADDELAIRNGLKFIIDWEGLGFAFAGEAGNGADALQDILRLLPDLLLLDINMPMLTGLEIIKRLRNQGYRGHIIILSGYSDFKFAQEAIQLGVDCYLTKPLDEDELIEAVGKIQGKLSQKHSFSMDSQLYREKARIAILHDLITGQGSPTLFQSTEFSLNSEVYQIVIYENFQKQFEAPTYSFAELLRVSNQSQHFFEYFEENGKDVILLKGSFALERFQAFLAHYEKTPPQPGSPLDCLFIAYGRPVEDICKINESYLDAATLIGRRFFCFQGQHILSYEELPAVEACTEELSHEKLLLFCTQLTEYLQSYNRKKVVEVLHSLEQYLYRVSNDISEVKLFLCDLFLQIKEKMNHLYNTLAIPFPTNSYSLDYIQRCFYLYEIIQFLSEQATMIMGTIGSSSRDSVLDDLLHYIDHNYHTNIKLESIAPLFGYNSAYLGKIFNKTVGESFNSYIDHVRIEHAKQLLLGDNSKVYEISEQVGYHNVDYFHKKFKKYVGESPAEFRKRNGSCEE